ncbi:MAG: GNAT family N-acetyltransferase [Psychroflexus sp.]|nr:GNAT family N-acetyltransferase [Psychroflexus sp.]MDR9448116.1 GNAT family N-acetyltransferase [Psychroflexus sp.]
MFAYIQQVSANDEFINLRHKLLRPGRARSSAFFEGDNRCDTFHFSALKNQTIVGIVSYIKRKNATLPHSANMYQLRGMAVDMSLRGFGIGKKLIDASVNILKLNKIGLIWCNSRKESVPFYLKNGFIKKGDYFDIPDVGSHILMYKLI